MTTAFRYSVRKYNDSLLSLGNLRIGTLHNFRKSEHKKGISDPYEGMKIVSHYIPDINDADKDMHLKALRDYKAIEFADSTNVMLTNIQMRQEFNVPDCFVHCISSVYSRSAMDSLEGADSCVAIRDVKKFYERLTTTINLHIPVDLVALKRVRYLARNQQWNGKDWGDHPALIKESEFSPQFEIRAIWSPKFEGLISPICINDIGLLKYCSMVGNP